MNLRKGIALAIPLWLASIPHVLAAPPVGNWSIIDESGEKRALIHIFLSGNTLNGTVISTFPKPGEPKDCQNCPDGFKNKPIKGLQILWGLKEEKEDNWSGGQIIDPKTGKIYKVKITVQGDKLKVRGYLGVSLIGRSQTWIR